MILSYVEHIRSEKQIPTQNALVIMYNFSAHSSGHALQLLEENGVLVVLLPANTTDRLQPLDLSINKAAKDHLRDKFRHLVRWRSRQGPKRSARNPCCTSGNGNGHHEGIRCSMASFILHMTTSASTQNWSEMVSKKLESLKPWRRAQVLHLHMQMMTMTLFWI